MSAKPICDLTVEELFAQTQGEMRAIALEAKDGILVGGLIVIRGERNFDLVCSFLTKPKEPIAPVI